MAYDSFYGSFSSPSSSISNDEAFARAFDLPLPSTAVKATSSSVRQLSDDLAELRTARSSTTARKQEKKKVQDAIRERASRNSNKPSDEEEQKHHRVVAEERVSKTSKSCHQPTDLRTDKENSIHMPAQRISPQLSNIDTSTYLVGLHSQLHTIHQKMKTEIIIEPGRGNTEKLDEYIATVTRALNKLSLYDPPIALIYRSWDFGRSVVNSWSQKIDMDIYVVTIHHLYHSSMTYHGTGYSSWYCTSNDLLQSRRYTFTVPLSRYSLTVFQSIATSQNGHTQLRIDHHSDDRNEEIVKRDREQLNKLLIGICETLPGYSLPPLPSGWKEMYMEHMKEYIYIHEKTLEHTMIHPSFNIKEEKKDCIHDTIPSGGPPPFGF